MLKHHTLKGSTMPSALKHQRVSRSPVTRAVEVTAVLRKRCILFPFHPVIILEWAHWISKRKTGNKNSNIINPIDSGAVHKKHTENRRFAGSMHPLDAADKT